MSNGGDIGDNSSGDCGGEADNGESNGEDTGDNSGGDRSASRTRSCSLEDQILLLVTTTGGNGGPAGGVRGETVDGVDGGVEMLPFPVAGERVPGVDPHMLLSYTTDPSRFRLPRWRWRNSATRKPIVIRAPRTLPTTIPAMRPCDTTPSVCEVTVELVALVGSVKFESVVSDAEKHVPATTGTNALVVLLAPTTLRRSAPPGPPSRGALARV